MIIPGLQGEVSSALCVLLSCNATILWLLQGAVNFIIFRINQVTFKSVVVLVACSVNELSYLILRVENLQLWLGILMIYCWRKHERFTWAFKPAPTWKVKFSERTLSFDFVYYSNMNTQISILKYNIRT